MKLSRKTKLNIAAIAAFIGLVLLGADETQDTTMATFLTVKAVGLVLFTLTAYICHRDVKDYGIPKEK